MKIKLVRERTQNTKLKLNTTISQGHPTRIQFKIT